MPERMRTLKVFLKLRLIVTIWVGSCVYVLSNYLISYSNDSNGELTILFQLKMLVLTFPLGYLAGLAVSYFIDAILFLGLDFSTITLHYLNVLLGWTAMSIVGFFQWFVFIPKGIGWIRKKLCTDQSESVGHP